MLSVLVVLICVFTVVGVAHIMELGSAAFFVVVVAGALVLLCFFCGLIAYARARVMAVREAEGHGRHGDLAVPVFYFLQTASHSRSDLRPVNDSPYWSTRELSEKDLLDQCPICLCDFESDPPVRAGVSQCCDRPLHVQCAKKYFNTVQRIQCPLCRHASEQV